MSNIDEKIQAALRHEPSLMYSDQPNVAAEAISVFRTQQRWLATLLVVVNVLAFGGVVFAGTRFCQTSDVSSQLRWGALAGVLLLLMALLKIWVWLEMHTNRVRREVKRLELAITSRAQR